MSFQTHKTLVILRNTNNDICNEIRELSDPANTTMQLKCSQTQRRNKDIVKTVHVTSVVQLYFYKAMRILFVCKEYKNNDFIQ